MTTESKPDEILSAPTETEMNDRRAAACIFELRDAIDRLTERCAAYKGQIEAGAKRIKMAEAENARLAGEQEISEAQLDRTITQRDAAEAVMSQAYCLVTGHIPEWSNKFGYEEALEDIREARRPTSELRTDR